MKDLSTFSSTATGNQENASVDFGNRLDSAIHKSRGFLLSQQTEEGYWVNELESNATITAELIFFMYFTDTVDLEKQEKFTKYLFHKQKFLCGFYCCYKTYIFSLFYLINNSSLYLKYV